MMSTNIKFRKYKKSKDKKSAFRVWLECGLVDDEKKDKEAFDIFLSTGNCRLADVNGNVECLIMISPGKMRYNDTDINLSAVTAVTTSRILRKKGIATELLASMIEEEIRSGVDCAGLGMFEQGYYNRLGFATMGYEHWFSFDPAKLKIFRKGGIPRRLNPGDWTEAYTAFSNKMMGHGFITLDPPQLMHAEMIHTKNGFGLGYRTDKKLSHYIWFGTDDKENGPYIVRWMVYQNWDQFLELMGILKNLEDQVRTIRIREPALIQIQDFIDRPFQLQTITRKSKYESRMRAIAYQQLRICNLENCIKAVTYEGAAFSFNLELYDPVCNFLADKKDFKGCAGSYTVSISTISGIKRGKTDGLPLIKGSINGFTRLWMGILPASTIGLTEDLYIHKSLMTLLEKVFYKPYAKSDLDY